MKWLASALWRNLGNEITVRRVQYRLRGWNNRSLDALRDAENALTRMLRDLSEQPGADRSLHRCPGCGAFGASRRRRHTQWLTPGHPRVTHSPSDINYYAHELNRIDDDQRPT
jgi:hypothetical protein